MINEALSYKGDCFKASMRMPWESRNNAPVVHRPESQQPMSGSRIRLEYGVKYNIIMTAIFLSNTYITAGNENELRAPAVLPAEVHGYLSTCIAYTIKLHSK
jgi:hypothetical protein